MPRLAIIGCGALGTILVEHLEKAGDWTLTGVMARTIEHAERLAKVGHCKATTDLNELLADQPDLVVEIAGIGAAKAYGAAVLDAGCDLVVVSAGAFADPAWRDMMVKKAEALGRRIHVASGAIGGFDVLRTAALMGVDEVTIASTKSPKSLAGAPGLGDRVLSTTEEEIAFEGAVEEAVKGFPKNVNVAAATALATGSNDLVVRVVSQPGLTENTHRIMLKAGTLRTDLTFASSFDPTNPRSSVSTAWSVLALLKNLRSPLSFF